MLTGILHTLLEKNMYLSSMRFLGEMFLLTIARLIKLQHKFFPPMLSIPSIIPSAYKQQAMETVYSMHLIGDQR